MKICHLIGALAGTVKPILMEGDTVVAVDGGLKQVEEWGLTPSQIVGDFDSLGYTPQTGRVHYLQREKDETDMEYGIKLGQKQGYTRFLIQGALGGRLDHTMGNLQLLQGLCQEGHSGILLGEGQNAMMISAETVIFPPRCKGYLSLFAMGVRQAEVDLENLAYSGNHILLRSTMPKGVSNEFLPDKEARVTVKQGAVLAIWEGVSYFSDYWGLLQ